MDKIYQKKATQTILAGLGALVLGGVAGSVLEHYADKIEFITTVVMYLALIIGCSYLGQAKGYKSTTGGILGIMGPVGLIILLVLKDKNKDL